MSEKDALKIKPEFESFSGKRTKHISEYLFAAYVIYIYDIDKMHCELFKIPTIQPILEITSFKENFKLDKPAMYFKGKPVYVCIRREHITRLLQGNLIDNDVKRSITAGITHIENGLELCPSGKSAEELHAKFKSSYIRKIFGQPGLNPQYILVYIISIAMAIVTTILVMGAIQLGLG